MCTAQQSSYSNPNSHQSASSISNPNPNPNSYLLTSSVPSSEPHQPHHGIDPYVNSDSHSSVLDNPVDKIPFFHDPNPVSRNCVAAQPPAVRYDAQAKLRASPRSNIVKKRSKIKKPYASKSGNPVNLTSVRISKSNASKSRGPVRCDLCDIDCISLCAYQTHLLGERHKRKLHGKYFLNFIQSQKTGPDGVIAIGGAIVSCSENLVQKLQKLVEDGTSPESVRICELCNVLCPDEIAFVGHLAGKKHKAKAGAAVVWCEVCKIKCDNTEMLQIHELGKKHQKLLVKQKNLEADAMAPTQAQPMSGEPSSSSSPNSQTDATTVATVAKDTGDKDQQETEIPQRGWCEVCKTRSALQNLKSHILGRKHQKYMVKHKNPEGDDFAPTETQPMSGEPSNSCSSNPQNCKRTRAPWSSNPEDMETKRRKMVEFGIQADAIRKCDICNAICNSVKALKTHLAGRKHASMVLKVAAAGMVPSGPLVSTAAG